MPPDAASAPPAPAGGRLAGLSLIFAVAAALSCWNPFAAPLGLLVGAVSAATAAWALHRRRGRTAFAVAGLVVGLSAAVAGGAVLLATAGAVTAELPGEPVVRGRSDAEAAALLDEAAKRTESSRRRAQRELERGIGAPAPAESAAGTAKDGAGLSPADAQPFSGAEDETE